MTLDLTAIQARVDAATPGPWTEHRKAERIEDGKAVYASVVKAGAQDIAYDISRAKVTRLPQDRYSPERSFDAAFIAAARSDIPALIREVQALRSRLATVTGAVKEWQEARKARRADPIDTRETHDRLRIAESALSVEAK